MEGIHKVYVGILVKTGRVYKIKRVKTEGVESLSAVQRLRF